jgi:hypothetical protein
MAGLLVLSSLNKFTTEYVLLSRSHLFDHFICFLLFLKQTNMATPSEIATGFEKTAGILLVW